MLRTARDTPSGDARLFLLLRLGVAFCFVGHGVFGLLRKPAWLPYFGLFGIDPGLAWHLMPAIGAIDIAVGVLALVWPARMVFLYAAGWALLTAALRPLNGEGVWEMLERAGNYGVPVVVLVAAGLAPRLRDGLARLAPPRLDAGRAERMLRAARWTTALLLLGHGALALQSSPLLSAHAAAVGLPAAVVPVQGVLEIMAALAVVTVRSIPLLLAVAAWKLMTEALFIVAGAPVWEWIERGGSYVAPVAAAWLLARARYAAGPTAGARRGRADRAKLADRRPAAVP